MISLKVEDGNLPELHCNKMTSEEIQNFSKCFGQCIVEIVNSVPDEEYTIEEKKKSIDILLKDAKQIAYLKMRQLGWILEDTVTLSELL